MSTIKMIPLLKDINRIHFIGIGGSGMFPLVQILHSAGYTISGSDNNRTDTTEFEVNMGIPVVIGQKKENIRDAELIIYTNAVLPDNEELIAAKASGIPMIERADLLAEITKCFPNSVCVSGTHGKTTASAMITEILLAADIDATIALGGKIKSIHGSGRLGSSDTILAEACEFQDHFLKFHSDYSVILNIDEDHLDYFINLDNIIHSFQEFANQAERCVFFNGDDTNTVKAVASVKSKVSFGLSSSCEYHADNIQYTPEGETRFDLFHGRDLLCPIRLKIYGKHNIINALAACAVSIALGVKLESIQEGLLRYQGVSRRFEFVGRPNGITVIDDYAHHPTELLATLSSAKELPFHHIWAVFQPFTYSRTKLLLHDFAKVLQIADHAIITDIMGGRESDDLGISSDDLVNLIPGSIHISEFSDVKDYVMAHAKPGDLVITLGCGDVNKCAKLICAE